MLLLLLKHHANRKAALPAIRVLFLSDAWTAQVGIPPPAALHILLLLLLLLYPLLLLLSLLLLPSKT
jgi:hypothetical protein